MKSLFSILVAGALLVGLTTCAFAEVPQMINYQGKLTKPDSPFPPDTTVSITFTIYDDSTNGIPLWQEFQPSVQAKYGIFSVLLGSVDPIPDTVFNGEVRYLGVAVDSDPEMQPRRMVVSVGYAFHSDGAQTADYANVAYEAAVAQHADIADSAETAGYAHTDDDWDGPGTGKMYPHDLNDQVGIGTSNPSYDLDVDEDVRIRDDLTVEGTLIMTFDYNSGWQDIDPDECIWLYHNLGGDENKYIVILDGKNPSGQIHQTHYGTIYFPTSLGWWGCEWKELDNQKIKVCRGNKDNASQNPSTNRWNKCRIRILKNQ